MKKILTLIIAILLFKTQLFAQPKSQNSLLWEVTGKDIKTPCYLFGTYHFAGKTFVDSLSTIRQKFNQCTAVAGEVIIDETVMSKMMPAMMLTGTTLDKIFTPAEYQQIADATKSITGTDLARFNTLKPAALQTVYLGFIAPKTVSETNPALDMYFQTEGKRRNEKVIGLEPIEDQIELLLNGKMDDQKKHLLAFVRKKDEFKSESQKLFRLYQQQDLDGLNQMLYSGDEYSSEEMDKLLKNRNLKWLAELPAIMSAQPTFIAVGAGHLVGNYGLINQLRLKGYTVKPVKI